jgi:hypothetical protein
MCFISDSVQHKDMGMKLKTVRAIQLTISPNVATSERSAPPLRIWLVPVSNTGVETGYFDCGFEWYS